MGDVTQILSAIERGDPKATAELLPLVYQELRRLAAAKMANEGQDHTLQATALVHEAYVRLVDVESEQQWEGRGHFFAAAAEAMRRILVEQARRKQRVKHGGRHKRQELAPDRLVAVVSRDPLEVLAIHEALDSLAGKSPRKAKLVKLRYFMGCTVVESARILGIAPATAEEDWAYAKAWLHRHLRRVQEKD